MALAEQTVVVTGGCGGIGSAVVRQLVRTGCRGVVAASDRPDRLAPLAAETGCEALPLDVTDREAVVAALGGRTVDVIVSAAGALGLTGTLFDVPANSARRVVDVNLHGLQNCLQAVVPGMLERDRGHIVTISSIAGPYPAAGQPVYAASKAAVHAMATNLRMELYGSSLRVSEIRPGRVATGMHREMFDGDEARAAAAFYEGHDCLTPQDVASAIDWVLSAPPHVDVTVLEIMPTHQVIGGVRFHPVRGEG
jgi:NADP-dependent 3-hydroxy acid dehydrogenase YdfG